MAQPVPEGLLRTVEAEREQRVMDAIVRYLGKAGVLAIAWRDATHWIVETARTRQHLSEMKREDVRAIENPEDVARILLMVSELRRMQVSWLYDAFDQSWLFTSCATGDVVAMLKDSEIRDAHNPIALVHERVAPGLKRAMARRFGAQ